MTPREKRFLYPLMVACFLTLAACFVIDQSVGGDALNGKKEDNRYYLGNHGRYTEVSYELYLFSYIEHCLLIGVFLLSFVMAFVLYALRDVSSPTRIRNPWDK
jgi:hypothetical protein